MSVVSTGPVSTRGVGLAIPLGLGREEVVDRWVAGHRALFAHDFGFDGLDKQQVARVPNFNARKQLPDRKAVKLMSREAQLLVYAAVDAVSVDACGVLGVSPERFGAFASAGYEVTPLNEVLDMFRASRDPAAPDRLSLERLFAEGRDAYNPLSPLKTLPNMALYHAAITLGLRGPHLALGSSPAAGLAALAAGVDALNDGRADAALVGGTDAQVEHFRIHYLQEIGATGAAPAEGAAAIVLGPHAPSVAIAAVGLGQEPVAGLDVASHYGQICDGGAAREALYAQTLAAARAVGAPAPGIAILDLWRLPDRDAHEQRAASAALGGRRLEVFGTRARFGQLGAAHGLVDVGLAISLIEGGEADSVLVTASGPAGDLAAAVVWGRM